MKRPIVLKVVVQRKVPSLNALFGMNHWARKKEKEKTQSALLSALDPSATDCSTPTTSSEASSILSTAYGTLALFMMTAKQTSSSRSRKGKSPTARKRKPKSP